MPAGRDYLGLAAASLATQEPVMIEEKDRYRAQATYRTARLADIPAGNIGQETDPTDKFTEPLRNPYKWEREAMARGFARRLASPDMVAGVFSLREPMRSVCGHPGRSHPENRIR
jgi:hypothetical protein